MWVSLDVGVWITSSLSHVSCFRHDIIWLLFVSFLALAKITLALPKGTSSSELLSPNYPDSFPDDDVMEWFFQVPDKHKTTVELLKLEQPRCLKKETAVEYHTKGRGASVLRLSDPQLEQKGNFSLTLRNCEMDRRRAGSPGLSLKLKVASSSKSSPGLYIICTWCCRLAWRHHCLTFFLCSEGYVFIPLKMVCSTSQICKKKWSDRPQFHFGGIWILKNVVFIHIIPIKQTEM